MVPIPIVKGVKGISRLRGTPNDLLAPSLAGATEANLPEHLPHPASSPSVEVDDTPPITRFVTGSPQPFMHGVVRPRTTSGRGDEAITRTLAYFERRGVPFTWCDIGKGQLSDLNDRPEAQGPICSDGLSVMAVDLLGFDELKPFPIPVAIEDVGDAGTLEAWVEAAFAGFGMAERGQVGRFAAFSGLRFLTSGAASHPRVPRLR